MTYGAHSQTDTVCIPRKDAIRALARIETLKADSSELAIRKDELKDLTALSDQQRVSIKNLQEKSAVQDLRIGNLQEQKDYAVKELKKVKAKAIVFKVAGIGVTAALTFALIAFK